MLDPDPHQINANPQPWFFSLVVVLYTSVTVILIFIFCRLVSKTDVSKAVLSLLKVSQVPALVALNKDLSFLGMEETAAFLILIFLPI
jgi:hypothetical protein